MRLILSVALALGVAAPATAQTDSVPQSPHTLTGTVSLVSSYRFAGIDQTFGKPALQGGVDYSHASGFYLGNWNSNVSEGAGYPAGNIEMDFYGGWKGSWGDWGVVVGATYYVFPGTDANIKAGTAFINPRDSTLVHTGGVDTKAVRVGASWKWISIRYYLAIGDYFSLPGTSGSNYSDLSGTWEAGGGWGVVGHVGRLNLKGWSDGTDATDGNYTDWMAGVTKEVADWLFGLSYIDTNAKGSCDIANPGFYCFPNQVPNAGLGSGTASFKDAGRAILVLSLTRTF